MVSAKFEPTNLGTRGQHANHQTTEAAQASVSGSLGQITYT
jgi:hypothetical protein